MHGPATGTDNIGINLGRHLDNFNQASFGEYAKYEAGHNKMMNEL